ncbi:hypothetical protein DL762_006799 [Monosporascus cannonballus]|uniref:Uncharacterized protein n=1 Tax=Monosporascus cannonballus TaxID=155416 RepID=A0ABY0H5B3_9PEZI|nr:hypothetical protein DL762_006799 [Monosporascus cannonballus]
MLKKVAPETRDREHDSAAGMLLRNSVSEAESARLKVLLYQLSNNMELALELREGPTDAQVVAMLKPAVSARKVGLVKVLIRAGAKVDLILQEHDLSQLELTWEAAALSANELALSTVSELVANGATIDRAADLSRLTALLLAVASWNADLVDFILESGAEVDRQYRPPDAKSLKLKMTPPSAFHPINAPPNFEAIATTTPLYK